MFAIKIVACTTLLTLIGIGSAEASFKAPISVAKTHAEVTIGAKTVTGSNQQGQPKSTAAYVCSGIKGMSYGAALVGIQSTLIVIPSFASGVGVSVAAIATGVGVVSTAFGFATMVAYDAICH